jgi:hypothetical protein
MAFFIVTAMKTSNLTFFDLYSTTAMTSILTMLQFLLLLPSMD